MNRAIKLIEVAIVKTKIFTKILSRNRVFTFFKMNNTFPNKWIAKVTRFNRYFYFIELNECQITYSAKGNTRSALSSIISYMKSVKAGVPSYFADLSDGGNDMPLSSGFSNLSFSSNNSNVILIPDHHFTGERGYLKLRKFAQENKVNWPERKNIVLWRGATTGSGLLYDEPLLFENERLIPRLRMCIKLMGVPSVDVGIAITKMLQRNHRTVYEKLQAANIAKKSIPQEEWIFYKFAIDIDGHTNAWKNLFCRMLMGCCVIKVESPQNFRQWYYHQLKPWVHYVPAKSDLSDLEEVIKWCLAHDSECENIGKNAMRFAFQIADYYYKI